MFVLTVLDVSRLLMMLHYTVSAVLQQPSTVSAVLQQPRVSQNCLVIWSFAGNVNVSDEPDWFMAHAIAILCIHQV